MAHHQDFWKMGVTPQHKNLNMLPSPKIEACFVMLPIYIQNYIHNS